MEPLLVYLTYAFIVNCYITHGLDLVSLWTDFDSLGVDVAFRNYNADKLVAVFVSVLLLCIDKYGAWLERSLGIPNCVRVNVIVIHV